MHSQNCPRVEQEAPKDFDESLRNYDELLDLYTECRLRHAALIEFEQQRK